MNNFWNVVGFTMRNKIRTKSFIITTCVIALLLSVGVNIPYFISLFNDDKPTRVGYTADHVAEVTGPLQAYYDALENADIELIAYPDAGSAEANGLSFKQAIRDKQLDGYIVVVPNEEAGFPDVVYYSEELLDTSTSQSLSSALQSIKTETLLQNSGLSEVQKALLLAPIHIQTTQISVNDEAKTGKTAEQQGLSMGFVYVMMILLFMGIFVTSQLIATEITAEKSSRVMEILVTSVAPLTQMFGKIVGMFLIGLLQIGTYVVVFIANTLLPHNATLLKGFNINFADIDPMLYVYGVLFYLTGYFLYSTMFAAVGSIVSRTEDLAQTLTPITFLSMAGFYIGIFGMTAPGSTIVKVASFIPFFSPFAMFLRVGLTGPAWWEIALSVAALLVTIAVLGWLSAKIYRTGVLMYGKRPTFKELRKAMKAYKV